MKKQFATRLDKDLIEKMKKAVEKNRPHIQSLAQFLEIAISDLLEKLKKELK